MYGAKIAVKKPITYQGKPTIESNTTGIPVIAAANASKWPPPSISFSSSCLSYSTPNFIISIFSPN